MLTFEYLVSDDGDVLDRPVREGVAKVIVPFLDPLESRIRDMKKGVELEIDPYDSRYVRVKPIKFHQKIYTRRKVAFPSPFSHAFHREWIRQNIHLAEGGAV